MITAQEAKKITDANIAERNKWDSLIKQVETLILEAAKECKHSLTFEMLNPDSKFENYMNNKNYILKYQRGTGEPACNDAGISDKFKGYLIIWK